MRRFESIEWASLKIRRNDFEEDGERSLDHRHDFLHEDRWVLVGEQLRGGTSKKFDHKLHVLRCLLRHGDRGQGSLLHLGQF